MLNHMRNRLSDYQEQYGDLYNLEATPAESTAYRLAKHDKKRFPSIITAGKQGDTPYYTNSSHLPVDFTADIFEALDGKQGDTPYYTNSSHLPVDFTADIFEALDIQDELQTLYTSGTVFHAFLGEKLPDWKAAASLVRAIAENYRLPYYTLSPTYSICREHGYLAGEVKKCPHCGAKTEVYSRITGYYRPVQNWNDGKLQEYQNRTEYDTVHSKWKKPAEAMMKLSDAAGDVIADAEQTENIRYLFTTKTCPNCKLAKEYLKDVKYVLIDAEENMELANRFGVEQTENIRYLFTTKTCPNCKLAKEYLKDVKYVLIDAEENMELANRFGVMQAPTLVVVEGGNRKKYVNVSNIKKYVDQLEGVLV